MTRNRPVDPVKPILTFNNYVIPDTVREEVALRGGEAGRMQGLASAALRLDRVHLAIGAIAALTFALGVLTVRQFAGPTDMSASVASAGNTVAPGAPETNPAALEAIVAASLDQEVTRTGTTDILSPTVPSRTPHLQGLQAAVIDGLMPKRTLGTLTEAEQAERVRVARDIISRNKLRMLREGVLAGLYSVETREEDGRRHVVLRTVNADMTSKTMADLLHKAARDGMLDVPASLTTAEGGVDMDTMIFDLVQTSLAGHGTPEGAEAARELSRRAFAASSAKTQTVGGQRVYVVERGDSLAYLSLQFYGRPDDYIKIFEANRGILDTPDHIQIGQRLIIPG
jgi:hypothetical protein